MSDLAEYEAELLEFQIALRDLAKLEGRRCEYRNAALVRNLASSVTSSREPNAEQLREWRSLSVAERLQAWDAADLPERRAGGTITFVGPMKGER